MKKIFAVLLAALLALASLPAFAANQKAELSAETADQIEAFLLQCREEGTRNFTITCTEALFDELRANSYAGVSKLCMKAGIDDPSYKYNYSGQFFFENVVFAENITYAEPATAEEASAAATRFVEMGAKGFTFSLSEELYETLFSNRGLYPILARLGVEEFQLSGSKAAGLLYVRNMRPFARDWAVADDLFAAGAIVSAWREAGKTAFTLVFDQEDYDSLSGDGRRLVEFLGGVSGGSVRTDRNARTLTYEQVSWDNTPAAYCASEEEIVAAIAGMGAQGERSFQLMTSQEVWDAIYPNSFARLYELHTQAGLSDCSLRYSSVTRTLLYDNAEITADVTVLASAEEAAAYMDECAARGEERISMFLTADVYDSLMEGVSSIRLFAQDSGVYSLAARAGIFHYGIRPNRDSGSLAFTDIEYFPGTVILRAVEAGEEGSLPPRLQETLAAARAMAGECQADSDVETARRIHDRLCETIVYTDDESTEEDDCAIGALLNGQANCDGYSDAMFLVGRLAGLEIAYQHGDSKDGGLAGLSSTHIWNVIRLDGSWRMVDVTWDDNESMAPGYLWFNIGQDRAARTHVWKDGVGYPLFETTDESARPVAEYRVATEEDVTAATADACEKGLEAFDLYLTGDSELTRFTTRIAMEKGLTGACAYFWVESLGCMHVQLG